MLKFKLSKTSIGTLTNVSKYLLSSGISRAIPFFLLPFLTRKLNPGDFGVIGILTLAISMSTLIIGFNPPSFIFAHYYKKKDNFKMYSGSIFSVLIINFLLFIIICTILYVFNLNFFKLPFWSIYLVILAGFFSSIYNTMQTINQIEKKVNNFMLFELFYAILVASTTVILVFVFNLSWQGRFIAGVSAFSIMGLLSIGILIKRDLFYFDINLSKMGSYLKFSLPLIPHIIGLLILRTSSKVFIAKYVSIEEAGFFQVAFQFSLILIMIYEAIFRVWNPFFYKHINLADNNVLIKNKIVKASYLYMLINLLILIIFIASSKIILPLFVGSKFSSSTKFIVWIALGFYLLSIYRIFGGYLYHVKKTVVIGLITTASVAVNVLLNIILIRSFGAVGSAKAMFLSYVIQASMIITITLKFYKMPWLRFWKYTTK